MFIMKKQSLVYIFLFLAISLSAQNKSESISCEISGPKSGNLWIGIENSFKITLKGIGHDKIEIKTEPEENIKKGNSEGEYIIKPSKGSSNPLKLSVISTEKKEILSSATFNLKKIPDPVVTINSLTTDKTISIKELKSNKSLFVFISDDFHKDFTYPLCNVTSFEYQYSSGSKITSGSVRGTNFDNRLLKLISKCKKNDKISFENINAKCQGDLISRIMGSFSLTVK